MQLCEFVMLCQCLCRPPPWLLAPALPAPQPDSGDSGDSGAKGRTGEATYQRGLRRHLHGRGWSAIRGEARGVLGQGLADPNLKQCKAKRTACRCGTASNLGEASFMALSTSQRFLCWLGVCRAPRRRCLQRCGFCCGEGLQLQGHP